MSVLLISNVSIQVFASDLNDGVNDGFDRYMGGTNIKGFNSWEITDRKSLFANNIGTFFAEVGMYFRGQSNQSLLDIFTSHLIETQRIENADSLDDYIASHLTANEDETELSMSADLTNALHETAVTYIEEETGFYVIPTLSTKDLVAENFYNKATMDAFKDYINNLGNDITVVSGYYRKTGGTRPYFYKRDDTGYSKTDIVAYYFNRFSCDDGFILTENSTMYSAPCIRFSAYNSDWVHYNNVIEKTIDGLSMMLEEPIMNTCQEYTKESGYYCTWFTSNFTSGNYTFYTVDQQGNRIFTSDGRSIRIYKTLDDFKNYSAGTRPYYITDAFNNYDSTIDNSTTITQTEIDNSVTYGDVYNYITNNYENPDGLSEDELRAILEEYLSSINNSGGGSGGSDSGGSGSGGGLGGFLDGLGSIGNAILAILGKLMEILGSAIELITGAITDLITIIPNSIGELLGALFPVFPEEWIKAITLSLVLGVIVGIMRMFK